MKKTALYSDILFFSTLIFFMSVSIFRYYRLPFPVAVPIGMLIGSLTGVLVFWRGSRKIKNLSLATEQTKMTEKTMRALAFFSEETCAKHLQKLFSTKTTELDFSFGVWSFSTDDGIYFCKFSLTPLTENDVLPIVRHPSKKTKTLLTNALTPEAESVLTTFQITCICGEKLYLRLSENDLLPPLPKEKKPSFSDKKKIWFRKKNGKGFFVGGILLLLSSLVTPFPFYYVVFGCILGVLSLIVRLFGYA